ncbi:MAG TPA: hypothetical protein VFO30_08625 [Chthoniobacterales bacterium]|nr:hypothetical protein [Chthoniobacterales bacterium]
MDSACEPCSIFHMWKSFAAFLLFSASAVAQEAGTAYEALRVVATQLNRESIKHVISVTGTGGTPQPESWKILIDDPRARGGVREIEVRDGRIESQRTPSRSIVGSSEGATIDTGRLNLDSSGAYAVASHTADKSHTLFSTVSYTLRTNERGEPVWIVSLHKQSGRPVGTIYIGATRGNVTRTEGLFAGAGMEDVETERDVEREGEDVRGIFDRTKSGISHAFYVAQQEARAMFERVKRSFSDFINGD